MNEMLSKQQLILLVNSLYKLQDKILSVKRGQEHIQQAIADKVQPLKAPRFIVWERLGYVWPDEQEFLPPLIFGQVETTL